MLTMCLGFLLQRFGFELCAFSVSTVEAFTTKDFPCKSACWVAVDFNLRRVTGNQIKLLRLFGWLCFVCVLKTSLNPTFLGLFLYLPS